MRLASPASTRKSPTATSLPLAKSPVVIEKYTSPLGAMPMGLEFWFRAGSLSTLTSVSHAAPFHRRTWDMVPVWR